jgi:hypothetical protein
MVVLVVVLIGGLGLLIYWAWNRRQANLAANNPQPAPAPVAVAPSATEPAAPRPVIIDGPVGPDGSIFDVPGGKSKHQPAPTAPSNASASAPPSAAPPPPDPGAGAAAPTTQADTTADDDQDLDWLAVRTAHSSPDQANAIIKYDSYRQEDPGKHAAQLIQYEADALEQLWWQRVLGLFNLRADLDQQIAAKQTDITDQPAGDFHNQLVAELADLRAKRNDADQKLTIDFAYTLPTPPDIDDRAAIAELDAKRDPDKFARWAKNTLTWIREHNGKPPWADE